MGVVVEEVDGSFDLDEAAAEETCVICMVKRAEMMVASCGNARHGACPRCLRVIFVLSIY